MKLKTPILLIAALGLTFSLQAQDPKGPSHHHGRHHEPIENMVSDLSAPQKKKLETIKKESHQRIKDLRHSQKSLRDSIRTLMDADGDQTLKLAPLYDREGMLQAKISKEMYSTRVSIDKVLTDKQRKELKSNIAKQRSLDKGNPDHKGFKDKVAPVHKVSGKKDGKGKHECKMDCKQSETKKAPVNKEL